MAKAFLASHGINMDVIMSEVDVGGPNPPTPLDKPQRNITKIIAARLPKRSPHSYWDISISHGKISDVSPHDDSSSLMIARLPNVLNAKGQLLSSSLCQAHIHLDKCFLLDDEKYSDLEIVQGSFQEAMDLTGAAKDRFDREDLLRRGARLVQESRDAGVTAMRAFVEVDEIVEFKCLDASLELKQKCRGTCDIQICAFAQLPIFTGDDEGVKNRKLMEVAIERAGVDVIGATPYVEDGETRKKKNVQWAISKALETGKHLDLHLDYNLDSGVKPLVWFVVEELKRQEWKSRARVNQTICLGHCTRLTLLTDLEWTSLREEIGSLPISFVGLPTSDMFMMGRPSSDSEVRGERVRGTLQVLDMIQKYDLHAAIATNNVGNAFTPQGNCDPLNLTSLATATYHGGTKVDGEILYECVSSRSKLAIGVDSTSLELKPGDPADFILTPEVSISRVSQCIPVSRQIIFRGRLLSHDKIPFS